MLIKRLYKKILPENLRKRVAGLPWIERLRTRQLIADGVRLSKAYRATHPPGGKIRVAFIVQRPALWCNHATIYEAMKGDSAFEVSVLAIPKRPPAAAEIDLAEYGRLKTFLKDKKISFFEGFDESSHTWVNPLTFGVPDVVFIPQPYSFAQSFLYHGEYLSRFCNVGYVPYGILLANMPEAQYQAPFFKTCWRIFVESEAHQKLYAQFNPELFERTVLTGHPKTDAYQTPPQTDGLWKLSGLRKRIIWAPHFTVSKDKTPHTFSTFFEYYDFFIQCAEMYPDIEFVLRPHPELFQHMVTAGIKTCAEAAEYRNRFQALPNGQVYEGGEIFEMFKESDALILDSISFLAEYLPSKRPICFLESGKRQTLNEVGEMLLSSYYKAWSTLEIKNFIEDVVVNENDKLKEKRLELMHTCLFQPATGAGFAIKEYIRKSVIPSGRSA